MIFEIDVQGKDQVLRRIPDATTIFIAPPSMEELRERLEARRTETPEKIALRLERAQSEMAASGAYQYCIINDDVDRAYRQLRDIFVRETFEASS